jgi:hypothetical protein
VKDGYHTLGHLAEDNGVTPRDVYVAIHKRFPDAEQPGQGSVKTEANTRGREEAAMAVGKAATRSSPICPSVINPLWRGGGLPAIESLCAT